MKTKILLILGIPVCFIISILAYFSLPWIAIYIGIQLEPNPPRPQFTYGEFPFSLEYELNGQRKVIKDTVICEYDGIGLNEGTGKHRKWKERLASGNEDVILLKIDDNKEILFNPGSAKRYMGDGDISGVPGSFPDALIVERVGRATTTSFLDKNQLEEQYKIKLISWDYTQPIKNNFTETKTKTKD